MSNSASAQLKWLQKNRIVRGLVAFKELWMIGVFFAAGAYACISYFATATQVKEIICALENQHALTLAKEGEIKVDNRISSLEGQNGLIMDFIVLLRIDENDTESVKRFKDKIVEKLNTKRSENDREIQSNRISSLNMKREIGEINIQMARREC